MKCLPAIAMAAAVTLMAQPSQADVGCLPSDKFDSIEFQGEVYGDHGFEMDAVFRKLRLAPIDMGWQIEIYREDGSAVPVRPQSLGIPAPDPTQITGQDFRNFGNTGAMPGAMIRKFVFGRNAVDPATNAEIVVPQSPPGVPVNGATVEPTKGELGIGELIVEDIGLADISKDQTPRLTYLKFSGCLGWHRGYRGPDWRMGADPSVPDESISALKQCGFNGKKYRLSDHTTGWGERGSRAYLDPDLMSDGIRDIIVPVTRRDDGQEGLGICLRSENRLTMAGFEDESDVGAFLELGEYWHVNRAPVKPGTMFPRPAGDGITVGIGRGANLFIFMDSIGNLHTRLQDAD